MKKIKTLGTITICGRDYVVKTMSDRKLNENKQLLGCCNWKDCEIEIDDEMNKNVQKEVFVHEVVHAILSTGGHPHKDGMLDCIANGFYQLGVGDYLWKKIKK